MSDYGNQLFASLQSAPFILARIIVGLKYLNLRKLNLICTVRKSLCWKLPDIMRYLTAHWLPVEHARRKQIKHCHCHHNIYSRLRNQNTQEVSRLRACEFFYTLNTRDLVSSLIYRTLNFYQLAVQWYYFQCFISKINAFLTNIMVVRQAKKQIMTLALTFCNVSCLYFSSCVRIVFTRHFSQSEVMFFLFSKS